MSSAKMCLENLGVARQLPLIKGCILQNITLILLILQYVFYTTSERWVHKFYLSEPTIMVQRKTGSFSTRIVWKIQHIDILSFLQLLRRYDRPLKQISNTFSRVGSRAGKTGSFCSFHRLNRCNKPESGPALQHTKTPVATCVFFRQKHIFKEV